MATRTSVATDDFDRASLGSDWAQLNSGFGSISITSNEAVGTTANWPNGPVARWVGSGTFTDDQYAKVVLQQFGFQTQAYVHGVACRASADTAGDRDFYYAVLKHNAGTATSKIAAVGKMVNGTATELATTTGISWAEGDTIELEVEGTDLRVYRNGSEITALASTDSDLASGQPGIIASNGVAYADDWEAGNLSTGGAGQPFPHALHARRIATIVR